MAHKDVWDERQWREMARSSAYQVDPLSRKWGLSRRQLERYSRKIFGCSPQKWLKGQRLLMAGKMLTRQPSVKTVAIDLGFKQVSHFSREFKRYFGVSPRAFLAVAVTNSLKLNQTGEATERLNESEIDRGFSPPMTSRPFFIDRPKNS